MCLHHQVQRGWGDRTYQDGGKFPVPLVTKIISLPSAWFRVEAPGLPGMHREREGIVEATVRSDRVQMSAEHYAKRH